MSLSTEFEDVITKINQANERCEFILSGLKMKELEYIESDGNQYIDTGIKASSNISVELIASAKTSNSKGYFIGGCHTGDANRYGFRSWTDANLYFYTASSGWPSTAVTLTSKHTYKTEKYILYIDGVKKITANSASFTSSYNMYLLANNVAGTVADNLAGKLYSCKIWEGSILVRDFIPVKIEDGTACLYDKVSETFFKNKGAGSFIAGPII